MANKLRLLIVDDHVVVRESLAVALAKQPDLEIVEACSSVEAALGAIQSHAIDLVVLDYTLGPRRGDEFVAAAQSYGFEGRILVISGGLTDAQAVRLIRLGVAGIISKEKPLDELLDTIRLAARGVTRLDERYLAAMARSKDDASSSLTERELAVLRCVAMGLANKEAAHQLHLSEAAVKSTLQRLFEKLAVRTRAQLVGVAYERFRQLL